MVETLLEVRNLSKTFRYRTGWFRRQTVEAVKPLSFTLRERQTLAIIGENGSGKSTLAKMLAGMIEPTSGELLIDDHPLHFGDYSFRSQRIRMIFRILNIVESTATYFADSGFPAPFEYRSGTRTKAKADYRNYADGRFVARPRKLLSAYAGTRAKAASGACPGVNITPESDYCRRSIGVSGYVDAFAVNQSDAGVTGKTRYLLYLCHPAHWDDEAYQ